MSRSPRGRCPACGKDVALRRGGWVREHAPADGNNASVCPGSGSLPDRGGELFDFHGEQLSLI